MAETTAEFPRLDGDGKLPERFLPKSVTDLKAALEDAQSIDDALMATVAGDPESEFAGQLNATFVQSFINPVNARDFGATGDGVTDDGPALRAASLAAIDQGRSLFIPRGTYNTSVTIPWSGRIYGEGQEQTIIYGTDPTKPVIATKSWMTEFGGSPTPGDVLENLRVRFGYHGVVLKSWRSRVENVFIDYSAGNGLHMTALNEAGASPDASLVGNIVRNVRIAYTVGIPLQCGELDNGKMTDGEVTKAVLIHTATSPYALLCGVSAGWQFDLLHTYGDAAGLTAAVRLQRCGNTQMGNILIERYKNWGLYAQLALTLSVDALNFYTTQEGGSLVRLERSLTYPTSAAHFGSISARSDEPFTSIIHNVASASEVKINAVDIQGEYRAPLASGTGAAHVRTAALTPIVTPAGGVIWGYDPSDAEDGPLAWRAPTSGDLRDLYWVAPGSRVIADGLIEIPAVTGGLVEADMDAGIGDGDLSATYAGGDAALLVFGARVNASNCVFALMDSSGNVTLSKRVGSTSSISLGSVAHTRAPGDVLAIRRRGTEYSVLVNGAEVIAPVSVAEHASVTKKAIAAAGATGQTLRVSAVEFRALPS